MTRRLPAPAPERSRTGETPPPPRCAAARAGAPAAGVEGGAGDDNAIAGDASGGGDGCDDEWRRGPLSGSSWRVPNEKIPTIDDGPAPR